MFTSEGTPLRIVRAMIPGRKRPVTLRVHSTHQWTGSNGLVTVLKGIELDRAGIPTQNEWSITQDDVSAWSTYAAEKETEVVKDKAERRTKRLEARLALLPADGTAINLRTFVPKPFSVTIGAYSAFTGLTPEIVIIHVDKDWFVRRTV